MQFVKNGPDVPDRLLQAHEDGRVVFFCGAGISKPAGLPGFKKLTADLYEGLPAEADLAESRAIDRKRFDEAIGLLENRLQNGRAAVRALIPGILTPTPGAKFATHRAILDLARTRSGNLRLVTTNYDLLFESAAAEAGIDLPTKVAPYLPIPKKSWNELVYLHGRVSNCPNELDRLVLSSGDFGLAYLVERWAARFVAELFQRYTVVFVGYSIDDPILRYMTDAIAADRKRGEQQPEMFAFGDAPASGNMDKAESAWRSKNVTPILYERKNRHKSLHSTLEEWARTYTGPGYGRLQVLFRNAQRDANLSDPRDDHVSRVLWALRDKTGAAAEYFSKMDPAPPLSWLDALLGERFEAGDLASLGFQADESEPPGYRFSIAARPPSHEWGPRMQLLTAGAQPVPWDRTMRYLGEWLARHLADPELLLRLTALGGAIHPELSSKLASALNRAGGSRAPFGPLWQLLLEGYTQRGRVHWDSSQSEARRSPERLRSLARWFAPAVSVRRGWSGDPADGLAVEIAPRVQLSQFIRVRIAGLVSGDAVLTEFFIRELSQVLREYDYVVSRLDGLVSATDTSIWVPDLTGDFDDAVLPAWAPPMILIVDLARTLFRQAHGRVAVLVTDWWASGIPALRRIALYVAAESGAVSQSTLDDWLSSDSYSSLWDEELQEEVLYVLAKRRRGESAERIEKAIIERAGAPDPDASLNIKEIIDGVTYSMWVRLAALHIGPGLYAEKARERLAQISSENPEWQLRATYPLSGQPGPIVTWGRPRPEPTPKELNDLTAWLRDSGRRDLSGSDWRRRCQTDPGLTWRALVDVANQQIWPPAAWRGWLDARSGKLPETDEGSVATGPVRPSTEDVCQYLLRMPEDALRECAISVARWVEGRAEASRVDDSLLLQLIQRLALTEIESAVQNADPLTESINHPAGLAIRALIRIWLGRTTDKFSAIPDDIRGLFNTYLRSGHPATVRAVGAAVGRNAVTLYRADESWFRAAIAPIADWAQRRNDWPVVFWAGVCARPALSIRFLTELQNPFLATVAHLERFPRYATGYSALLAFFAVHQSRLGKHKKLLPVFGQLQSHPDVMGAVARRFSDYLNASTPNLRTVWANEVRPVLTEAWPVPSAPLPRPVGESLLQMCVTVPDLFGEMFLAVRRLLAGAGFTDQFKWSFAEELRNSGALDRFPDQALEALWFVYRSNGQSPATEIADCLAVLRRESPAIVKNSEFVELAEQYSPSILG